MARTTTKAKKGKRKRSSGNHSDTPKARIRYRISSRYDLRSLNYATQTSEQHPDLEENPETLPSTDTVSFAQLRAPPRETPPPRLTDFREIAVESRNIVENDFFSNEELNKEVWVTHKQC